MWWKQLDSPRFPTGDQTASMYQICRGRPSQCKGRCIYDGSPTTYIHVATSALKVLFILLSLVSLTRHWWSSARLTTSTLSLTWAVCYSRQVVWGLLSLLPFPASLSPVWWCTHLTGHHYLMQEKRYNDACAKFNSVLQVEGFRAGKHTLYTLIIACQSTNATLCTCDFGLN